MHEVARTEVRATALPAPSTRRLGIRSFVIVTNNRTRNLNRQTPSKPFELVRGERVDLYASGPRGAKPFCVDFVHGPTARRGQANSIRQQPLAKAIGLRVGTPLTVIDATAGLARDAFQMACWGSNVIAIERSHELWELVQDGLQRASRHSESLATIVSRITLMHGDSIELLSSMCKDNRPDVIYLDPMYPESRKSAAVKKEMRICRALVGDDADSDELCTTARETGVRRVVVKRHRLAPPLCGPPSMCIRGTRIRFDVYLKS
ncbi:MAG: class I SAM-dependent methyltransferase [Planctomycetes bacterium]|nr:class I SAM-dependent methyltransferase [Planctomycetota bacterium]MBI3835877.1 class I SAM-dependent methyltransferase [Planctomycetota bacterium]